MPEHQKFLLPPDPREGWRDPLTNLPNRAWLDDYLPQLIESSPGQFGLLFIDLDGLKEANDTHGHATGDELIKTTADIASSSIRHWHPEHPDRPPDSATRTTFRLGGDEFVILAREVEDEHGLEVAKDRIQSNLARAGIKASIGMAMHQHETAAELLDLADNRMYEDKIRRKLESYTPAQRDMIRHLGDTALMHNINLHELATAYKALKTNTT